MERVVFRHVGIHSRPVLLRTGGQHSNVFKTAGPFAAACHHCWWSRKQGHGNVDKNWGPKPCPSSFTQHILAAAKRGTPKLRNLQEPLIPPARSMIILRSSEWNEQSFHTWEPFLVQVLARKGGQRSNVFKPAGPLCSGFVTGPVQLEESLGRTASLGQATDFPRNNGLGCCWDGPRPKLTDCNASGPGV